MHVFRTYITGAHGPNIFMRRRGGDGWAYQGFNYPKSVWGGQLKAKIRTLEGEQRAEAYKADGRDQHAHPQELAGAAQARPGTGLVPRR